jgi:peptidoglycan biosynthesis protein MviN/MurJ (putative lipid II flippase)
MSFYVVVLLLLSILGIITSSVVINLINNSQDPEEILAIVNLICNVLMFLITFYMLTKAQ